MIVRYYIFNCARKGRNLNVYQVQLISKEKYVEQQLLAKLNNKLGFDSLERYIYRNLTKSILIHILFWSVFVLYTTSV